MDSSNYKYNKEEIIGKFPTVLAKTRVTGEGENVEETGIPFQLREDDLSKSKDCIINSEIKYESWFIENPVSKELTKRITLKLGPKAE